MTTLARASVVPPAVLDGIESALATRSGRLSGDEWSFCCPAHPDRKPSASFNRLKGAWKCHRCGAKGGWKALSERLAVPLSANGMGRGSPRLTVYEIRRPDGSVASQHTRYDYPDGSKDFRWPRGTRMADLPLYRSEDLSKRPDDPVFVVEGEKAADALRARGLLALGTATGADGCPSPEVFTSLKGRRVLLWPDNDDPGRRHMARVAERLAGVAEALRWIAPAGLPPKGDAVDWLAARADGMDPLQLAATLEGLGTELPASVSSRDAPMRSFAQLLDENLPELQPVVEGLIYEGVTLLVGKAKTGKSRLGLNLALAVAKGSLALGKYPTRRGRVLYLTLEDGKRRFKKRLEDLLGGDRPELGNTDYATDWPRINDGGAEKVREWFAAHPDARLVVIDTLARVRPGNSNSDRDRYTFDYATVAALQDVAKDFTGTAIIVVHHTRKATADDVLDEVSGTTGLTAAADSILILKRPRNKQDADLHIVSRDAAEGVLVLSMGERGAWTETTERPKPVSKERRTILDYLNRLPEGERAWPKEIAEGTGQSGKVGSIKHLLGALFAEGLVKRDEHGYFASGEGETRRRKF